MSINNEYSDYSQYADNRDVISLFSGAMGLDIGLEKSGLNIAIGQDFDISCVKTMRENGHKVLSGDIREIEPQQLLEITGLHTGEPFMICGGPPCQPFSTAGKRLGINDPRGKFIYGFHTYDRLYTSSFFCHGKCKRNHVFTIKICSVNGKR